VASKELERINDVAHHSLSLSSPSFFFSSVSLTDNSFHFELSPDSGSRILVIFPFSFLFVFQFFPVNSIFFFFNQKIPSNFPGGHHDHFVKKRFNEKNNQKKKW